jgi:hypothetical protein
MKHEYLPSAAETAEVQARAAGRRRGANYYKAIALSVVTGLSGGLAESAYANPAQAPAAHETPTYLHTEGSKLLDKILNKANFESTPAETVKSVKTKNHTVIINGKPTILVGYWAQTSPKEKIPYVVQNFGVNVILDRPDGMSEQQLSDQAAGQYWQLGRTLPGEPPSDFPNSLGVFHDDEADGGKVPLSTIAQEQTLPGKLVFQNFTQHLADYKLKALKPDSNITVNTGTNITPQYYMDAVKNLGPNGVVGFDFYQYNQDSATHPDINAGLTYHYTKAAMALAPANMPVEVYIEVNNFMDGSKPITPEIVGSECRGAFTAGANIISPWALPANIPPENTAAFKNCVDEARRLAPIILAKQIDGISSDWNDPVKTGARIITNQDGSVNYAMIFANTGDKPVVVTKKLYGLSKDQIVANAVDGSAAKALGGNVKLNIEPGKWAIEVYTPDQLKATKSAAAAHAPKHTKSITLVRPKKP